MTSDDPFGGFLDADQVLAGMPAKRANTLLYLIESRTARLVARSRQVVNPLVSDQAVQQRDLEFLGAFALETEPPLRPTIQDLERMASAWTSLVPDSPRIRAALAHRLGEKYQFSRSSTPHIRAALGLDTQSVATAYERLYSSPIESIYATRTTPLDRLRWAWAGLAKGIENLPPFWIAYALTVTETIGVTILALPVALAGIGPVPGVVLLVILGLVNVLTIAFVAEAMSRSGSIRYGSGFVGKVVSDYLGRTGSIILSVGTFGICFLVLQVFYIGFSRTLREATGVTPLVWVVLLFAIGIFFMRRGSLDATLPSALVVGAVNVTVVITLSIIAFTHVTQANLAHAVIPLVGGQPLDRDVVGLVFGVVLAAYFGHLSVSACARVSLGRDPSARSLIWGAAAAQLTAIVLYCLFVLAVNGALDPETLAGTTGTVLGPLAAEIGPVAYVLGSVFVVLGMGMGSIQYSVILFNLVRERLPTRSQTVLVLPRRQGRLVFRTQRHGPSLALVYLGLDGGAARFRLDAAVSGEIRRLETTVRTGRWDLLGDQGDSDLREAVPELRDRHGHLKGQLTVEVLAASLRETRVRVTATRRPSYEGDRDLTGLDLGDVVDLPEVEAGLLGWMTRQGGVQVAEVASYLDLTSSEAQTTLDRLVADGLATRRADPDREPRYETRLATRRGRRGAAALVAALETDQTPTVATPTGSDLSRRPTFGQRIAAHPAASFLLAMSPVALAFGLAVWSLATNSGSFTGLLSLVGVLIVPILGGILPVLLLVAGRRKGERLPTTVYRFLGNRFLLGAVYLLFFASIALHGLLIWEDPLPRVLALAVCVGLVIATIVMRKAFRPRTTIELRRADERGVFSVVADGRLHPMNVRLRYPGAEQHLEAAEGEVPEIDSLQEAAFDAGRPNGEVKVWAHSITPEEDSQGLNGQLLVRQGERSLHFDLVLADGTVVLPATSEPTHVRIVLAEPDDDVATPP